jgi:hypothetical protein
MAPLPLTLLRQLTTMAAVKRQVVLDMAVAMEVAVVKRKVVLAIAMAVEVAVAVAVKEVAMAMTIPIPRARLHLNVPNETSRGNVLVNRQTLLLLVPQECVGLSV